MKAPRKVPIGTRPVVTVTVRRGAAPAGGTVVVTVGTKSKTLTLQGGTAKLRLTKVRKGKAKITVRYLGDATTTASTETRTITVTG